MTIRRTERSAGGRWRLVLSALLLTNTLMQVGGGVMMLARPEKMARDLFRTQLTGDTATLVAVIGGATLSYALVSAMAAVSVFRRLASARASVLVVGAMLVLVGAVMLGHGLSVGAFDLAKGAVFVFAGWGLRAADGALARV